MGSSVGIVGGGILGLTSAYHLAQEGVAVTVFERAHLTDRLLAEGVEVVGVDDLFHTRR